MKNREILIEAMCKLEAIRRNPKHESNYEYARGKDYAYRQCCAMIAKELGYISRVQWENELAEQITMEERLLQAEVHVISIGSNIGE
jgi:hypothetical protein